MRDLESLVNQVWNPQTRPLVKEAWQCYNSGAIRSAIVMTWIAVCMDLVDKIEYMADTGVGDAKEFAKRVRGIRQDSDPTSKAKGMQSLELDILDIAKKLFIVDSVTVEHLNRLRRDRHLSAHPSLLPEEGIFIPLPELARAHLATALTEILSLPPTQGRRILDAFRAYITDDIFVPSEPHVISAFYDHIHESGRKNIIKLAVKHAMLEPEVDGHDSLIVANRMAEAVCFLVNHDRGLLEGTVRAIADRFDNISSEKQIRVIVRLGTLPEFWNEIGDQRIARLSELVPAYLEDLADLEVSARIEKCHFLQMVRFSIVRESLPGLEDQFLDLSAYLMGEVMTVGADPYFVQSIPIAFAKATSFLEASSLSRPLLAHARWLAIDDLRNILHEWQNNFECIHAFDLQTHSLDFCNLTIENLGPEALALWQEFFVNIRNAREIPEGYNDLIAFLDSSQKGLGFRSFVSIRRGIVAENQADFPLGSDSG